MDTNLIVNGFDDVELIYVADKFKACLKYTQLLKFNDEPQMCVQQLYPACCRPLFVS